VVRRRCTCTWATGWKIRETDHWIGRVRNVNCALYSDSFLLHTRAGTSAATFAVGVSTIRRGREEEGGTLAKETTIGNNNGGRNRRIIDPRTRGFSLFFSYARVITIGFTGDKSAARCPAASSPYIHARASGEQFFSRTSRRLLRTVGTFDFRNAGPVYARVFRLFPSPIPHPPSDTTRPFVVHAPA